MATSCTQLITILITSPAKPTHTHIHKRSSDPFECNNAAWCETSEEKMTCKMIHASARPVHLRTARARVAKRHIKRRETYRKKREKNLNNSSMPHEQKKRKGTPRLMKESRKVCKMRLNKIATKNRKVTSKTNRLT